MVRLSHHFLFLTGNTFQDFAARVARLWPVAQVACAGGTLAPTKPTL